MERETRIPEVPLVPEGWELDGQPVVVAEDNRDELGEALLDAISILRQVGGVVQIAPVRVKLGEGVYVTTEYVFRWNSFAPALEPAEAEEPEPAVAE